MKKGGFLTCLFIFSFLLMSSNCLVSAKNITLDFPSEVNYGEVFDIELDLIDFAEKVYDVKIDITNSNGERISKILNKDEWKTTYNYVLDAIDTFVNTKDSFSLNITEPYNGIANIEVKIRNSVVDSFTGYEIHVSQENSEQNDDNEPEENEEDNENQEPETENEPEISLDTEWNKEDIINGKEFDIDLKVYNLKSEKYDVRIWIEFKENNTVISDRYDNEADEWKSGRYYVDNFFTGPGNKTEDIKLRIREDFIDFDGNARLFFKLRNINSQIEKTIKILPAKEEQEENAENETEEESNEEEIVEKVSASQEKEIIRLGTRKTVENTNEGLQITGNVLYESSSEKIKKYGIYALVFVLVLIIIFLIKKKL